MIMVIIAKSEELSQRCRSLKNLIKKHTFRKKGCVLKNKDPINSEEKTRNEFNA